MVVNSFHPFTDTFPPSSCFIDYDIPVIQFPKCFRLEQLHFNLKVALGSPHFPCKCRLQSHGQVFSVQDSSDSPSTDIIAVHREPCGCSRQNGGDAHIWNAHRSLPRGWPSSLFSMAFESVRWDKDVTTMTIYEMRVNKCEWPCIRELSIAGKITIKTESALWPPCCISITTQLCGSSRAGNQARNLQMFSLCAVFFSVTHGGRASRWCVLGNWGKINSPNWSAFGNLFTSWFSTPLLVNFKYIYISERELYHQTKHTSLKLNSLEKFLGVSETSCPLLWAVPFVSFLWRF